MWVGGSVTIMTLLFLHTIEEKLYNFEKGFSRFCWTMSLVLGSVAKWWLMVAN